MAGNGPRTQIFGSADFPAMDVESGSNVITRPIPSERDSGESTMTAMEMFNEANGDYGLPDMEVYDPQTGAWIPIESVEDNGQGGIDVAGGPRGLTSAGFNPDDTVRVRIHTPPTN